MTDASTGVQSFYGRWSRLYDLLAGVPLVSSSRDRAAESLALDHGDSVVEMGCGTGANLPYLRDRVGSTGRVVGLDVTREMLARVRGRVGADLLQADATRPPLVGTFDGLLGCFVVAMFQRPATVVDTWCDLVKPGGRVAFLHFTRSERGWARPLNALYRGFVWLSSTNKRRATNAAERHDQTVRTAYDTLRRRTTDYREERLAGGYLVLASGTVPAR